ncbi:hypothetical protein DYB38_012808 [Aphanomyces astaci]|uniref:Uncharacterized protein n=2 Tax=Aphanomyces astaci TaxID=112090 RepID=A0A397CQ00_APHAT|nr:hypothetical protein DYB38_012808 [Aphanomyces astaci]
MGFRQTSKNTMSPIVPSTESTTRVDYPATTPPTVSSVFQGTSKRTLIVVTRQHVGEVLRDALRHLSNRSIAPIVVLWAVTMFNQPLPEIVLGLAFMAALDSCFRGLAAADNKACKMSLAGIVVVSGLASVAVSAYNGDATPVHTLVKPIQDSTNLVDFVCAVMAKDLVLRLASLSVKALVRLALLNGTAMSYERKPHLYAAINMVTFCHRSDAASMLSWSYFMAAKPSILLQFLHNVAKGFAYSVLVREVASALYTPVAFDRLEFGTACQIAPQTEGVTPDFSAAVGACDVDEDAQQRCPGEPVLVVKIEGVTTSKPSERVGRPANATAPTTGVRMVGSKLFCTWTRRINGCNQHEGICQGCFRIHPTKVLDIRLPSMPFNQVSRPNVDATAAPATSVRARVRAMLSTMSRRIDVDEAAQQGRHVDSFLKSEAVSSFMVSNRVPLNANATATEPATRMQILEEFRIYIENADAVEKAMEQRRREEFVHNVHEVAPNLSTSRVRKFHELEDNQNVAKHKPRRLDRDDVQAADEAAPSVSTSRGRKFYELEDSQVVQEVVKHKRRRLACDDDVQVVAVASSELSTSRVRKCHELDRSLLLKAVVKHKRRRLV